MAQIKVDSTKIRNAADSYNRAKTQMNSLSQSLNDIYNRLEQDIKETNNVGKTLKNIINQIESITKKAGNAAAFLVTAANDYSAVEMGNVVVDNQGPQWTKAVPAAMAAGAAVAGATAANNSKSPITIGGHRATGTGIAASAASATGGIGSALKSVDSKEPGVVAKAVGKIKDSIGSEVRDFKENLPGKAKQEGIGIGIAGAGALVGTGIQALSNKLGIEGHSSSAVAEHSSAAKSNSSTYQGKDWAAVTNASVGTIAASAKASAVFDPSKGNIAAGASASFKATGAEVVASVVGKCGSASASAAAGVVEAGASASVSFMERGSINPKVAVSTAAVIAAAEAKASARAGNDTFNAGVGAVGAVGAVRGSAALEFDPAKMNVGATVGGVVAAAEGTVKASADIGIIKGSVVAKGFAGGVGASASIGIKDGTLKVGLGAALGVGGSVDFEVGVGSFVNKIDKVTGGVVSGAVGVLNAGIQVAAAPVNAVVNSAKAVISGAKDFGSSIGKGDVVGAAKAVVNTAENVVKSVGSAVDSAAKAVGDVFATTGKAIAKFFSRRW